MRQPIDPLDAELLVAHVLKKPREWILAHPEFKIKDSRLKIIKKLIARRANGEPIAYLTGHKEFFGLDFEVNKGVLIPRPDTETMVEEVIEEIKRLKDCKITLVDVGTGSGNIPIAIANHIRKSGLSVNPYNIIAIDISKRALTVAKRNAKKHGVKIKFLHGDLLTPVIARSEVRAIPRLRSGQAPQSSRQQIIITANLPYLSERQFKSSPSIQHEPRLALVAKDNGLALYKKLLKQIRQLLKIENCKLKIFLEIDPSQSKSITLLIKSILPGAKIEIKKDLSGLDRVVKLEIRTPISPPPRPPTSHSTNDSCHRHPS